MGDTYVFSKIRRSDFLSGKTLADCKRYQEDEDCYDPLSVTVGGELDRAYYLFGLLDCANKEKYLGKSILDYYQANEKEIDSKMQAIPISPAQVERAINILKELDEKVFSMPYDKGLVDGWHTAGFCNASCNDVSKCGYVEPVAPLMERQVGSNSNYVFYGPTKEFVDIVKEVYRVYGYKYYHYRFPWQVKDNDGSAIGSYDVQLCLRSVLRDMQSVDLNDWIYVLNWF